MDEASFNQCLDSGEYRELVEQETQEGISRGVRGTPTLFVDGELIEGGNDYSILREAIESALIEP